ncbi:MAG: DUF4124 domain-containing protein [Steroidobacteraceae bacterium]|jgi:hypothetical protein
MKRVLLCAALLAWSGLASAVVYKWVDSDGKVQYGDNPPIGVHAEIVPLLGTHPNAQQPSSSPRPSQSETPSAPSPKVKQAVDQDVAATKAKQCAEAQDHYKQLIEGRHLYKLGDSGERVFLTSEEIDTQRLNAKQDADNACSKDSP